MDISLENVFNPRSIAVIGASEVAGKASERRTRSLLEGGYRGEVYLINPKRSELFGRRAYPRLTEIDAEVDLVMIVVPPRFLVSAVQDSIKMGAKGIIIITAGLGETGDTGKDIEKEIMKEASRTGTFVIGPNCSGMFSVAASMNMLGVPGIDKGPISVLAQSGNVIDSLTHYARMRKTGFSKIVSVGNAIGVNFHDYIDYLKEDPDTKVIMAYLEGIKEGDKLVRVVRQTGKPVIALKVGRSKAGARAAASHTGSLAGDDAIVEAAFRQAGIIRATNVDQLFDMAEAFSTCPLPNGNRVAILSEGGGDNSIAADNAETQGMEVPVLSQETQDSLKPFLLEGMSAANPIDYGGTAEENPEMINECVNVCMADKNVDGIFLTGFFGGFKDIIAPHVGELEEKASEQLVRLVEKYQKPLFLHTSYAGEPIKSLKILKSAGIPVLESSERATQCLSALMRFSLYRKKYGDLETPYLRPEKSPDIKVIFDRVRNENRTNLLETESRDLLKAYGVELPEAVLAQTRQEAVEAAGSLDCPLAMKIVCRDIIHKSDAGGIKLNLKTQAEVKQAFDEVMENACRKTSRDRITGGLISPMAGKGQECIIGMIRDRQFGPVIMFGLGGIFVEVLKDVSFRVAPLAEIDVDDMIKEIKGYRLLTGVRGEAPKDVDALKDIMMKISEISADNPEIMEIDLNPVIVHEKGASIVDSRVILSR